MYSIINCILVGFFIFVLIVLLSYRITRSVETTDEIHGIASIINIIQGKKPFVTSWDYHTGWCLVTPFYYCFLSINNGKREGVVLFSRVLYFVITIIISGFSAILVYKKTKKIAAFLLIGLTAWVPFSIFQLSYNSLTVYLLLLGTVLISNNLEKDKSDIYWLLAGIVFGFVCINYPTVLLLTFLVALLILNSQKHNRGLKKSLFFTCGVLVVGLTFAIWVLSDSSLQSIIAGITSMLNSPHEKTKGIINFVFLRETFCEPFLSFLKTKNYLLVYLIIQTCFAVCFKLNKSLNKIISTGSLLLYLVFMIYNAYYFRSYTNLQYYSLNLFISTIAWIICDKYVFANEVVIFVAVEIAFSLIYCFTSDNKNFMLGIMLCNILTVYSGIVSLLQRKQPFDIAERHTVFDTYKDCINTIIIFVIFIVPGILSTYSYVYRDQAIEYLNTKVSSGVFEGLYTSKERREFIMKFEDFISENTNSNETICVVTREPMIYVMSDARIQSPQTWDPQYLYRGYTSSEPLLSYFKDLNIEYPDTIIATNSAPSDFFENNQYEIKEFINENYSLYRMEEIDGIKVAIWHYNQLN